ncbi:SsrA-binding protein SmpB [bacterium]|nr:SsrA-binding protein SmpB [bacterium]
MVITAKPRLTNRGLIAENRKAHFNYTITDTFEAGLALNGDEVKSLRLGQANITDGYATPTITNGFIINNITIGRYASENPFGPHDEKRPRPLLLNKTQIKYLIGVYSRKGATIVPLKLYFNERGLAKLLIGVGLGKKEVDKRETIKAREWERDKARILKLRK